MPGLLRCTCGDYARALHLISHARLRVHWAPGIPCALCFLKGPKDFMQKLGRIAPRDRGVVFDENERAALSVVIARATTVPMARKLPQPHPRRRVVAGAFLGSHLAVDAGLDQARRNGRAEQQMIEPQSGVARPAVSLVIPERVHRL